MASHSQDIVSMQEIVELVKLLRQNGDKVLSASSKLSLSTKLLRSLNEAFSLIVVDSDDLETSFQVCNSSKIDIFRDVKFLHDFVQKTVGLKVTHYSSDPKVIIDISKFRHLKYLELKKVPIELVKGLQSIRGQLESIVCAGKKGVSSISQLLAICGADAGVGFVWASLRSLALPHNVLECLDESLELAPWLQTLDLSHNMITSAKEIFCLSNLKYVNLGYNRLEGMPTFNKAVLHSLQVLVLKNNYIDNLNGLQGLECLTELDLSYNCLAEHSILWPLQKMSALMWVSLEGNPLSYHSKHRALSLKHLHPSLANSKFVLDHLSLSKSEKVLVMENRVFTIRADRSASLTSSISVCTDICESSEGRSTHRATASSENSKKSTTKNKKKPSVKEAIIAEVDQENEEFKQLPDVVTSSHLEVSTDHLETKKRMLAVREKFGENNWLSSHAGTFVQDIMGLQSVSQSAESPIAKIQTLADINSIPSLHDSLIYMMGNEQSPDEPESPEIVIHAEDVEKDVPEEKEEEVVLDEPSEVLSVSPVITYDPKEEAADLYLVQKRKTDDEMEDIFLTITSEDIKERDTNTGKVKYSWSTNSVLSCVLGRSDPPTVDIIFDTTRKDRENRRYYAELKDAKKIVATISEQLETRPILLKIFKCMKCSTQFSQDAEYVRLAVTSTTGAKQIKCPTCDSTLVIETEALPNADSQTTENIASTNLQHSESFSSIGGTEGGAKSVTTSLVHSDSHIQAQVCCSATSLEESRGSTPSTNALAKKYESDIEILSNPSQSSIEVLDETLKINLTPNRKRSTQERRAAAIAPSLITIPDTTPVMAGLTESSSSGSLTDSICTAYENKMVKSTNIDAKSHTSDGDKESNFTPVTNLTSMLGGLLQSIKIGSNKMIKSEEASNFFSSSVQYSYTDFSSVDHRIKLHIILNIFEHENEELVFLLRADILMHSMQETFPGCLVLSTSKVYILKINGPEGEDPQRWLQKEVSWTMDRLRSFIPLPFKQGVLLELEQPGKIGEEHLDVRLLFILQDFQRTSNFLFYITDLRLPPSCEVEFSVPEHCSTLMHNLLTSTANYHTEDAVRLLAMFSCAVLKQQSVTTKLKLSGLIVTGSALVILEDNVQWLVPGSNQVPLVAREQAMSNLIAIEHCDTSLTLNFLDEVAGLEESWNLEFVSPGAVEAVISSIQPPWEELFSIPLQIITRTMQDDTEKVKSVRESNL